MLAEKNNILAGECRHISFFASLSPDFYFLFLKDVGITNKQNAKLEICVTIL